MQHQLPPPPPPTASCYGELPMWHTDQQDLHNWWMLPPRALATVHVMVSTYGENEDEEESIVILATSIYDW